MNKWLTDHVHSRLALWGAMFMGMAVSEGISRWLDSPAAYSSAIFFLILGAVLAVAGDALKPE